MVKCPFCNTENVKGAMYCENCGMELPLEEITIERSPSCSFCPKKSITACSVCKKPLCAEHANKYKGQVLCPDHFDEAIREEERLEYEERRRKIMSIGAVVAVIAIIAVSSYFIWQSFPDDNIHVALCEKMPEKKWQLYDISAISIEVNATDDANGKLLDEESITKGNVVIEDLPEEEVIINIVFTGLKVTSYSGKNPYPPPWPWDEDENGPDCNYTFDNQFPDSLIGKQLAIYSEKASPHTVIVSKLNNGKIMVSFSYKPPGSKIRIHFEGWRKQ